MPDIFVSSPSPSEPTTAVEELPEKSERKPLPPKAGKKSHRFHHHFLSLINHPRDLRFESQGEKEKIVLLLRRHPITNLPWMALVFVMALTPSVLNHYFGLDFIPLNFRLMGGVGWYLLTFAIGLANFLCWFFTVEIITDERVIDIDFMTILNRHVGSARIANIEEVNAQTGGFIRSLFNYGDVTIQTAGASPEIIFDAVPEPAYVTELLNESISQIKHRRER